MRLFWWLLRQLSRKTPSLSRSAMIFIWVSWPWVLLTTHFWSCNVGKIQAISFWKSKTPIEKSSAVNFGKSRWNTKTKNVFLFNQRQNIKIKENKTRIKRNEFHKALSTRIQIFLESAKFSFRSWNKSFRVQTYPYSNRICPSTLYVFTLSSSANLYLAIFVSWENLPPIFFNDCFTDKTVLTSTNSLVYGVQFVCPTYSYFEKGCRKKCARDHSEK